MEDPSFEGVLLITSNFVKFATNAFKLPFRVLNQKLCSGHIGLEFSPNHYFYEAFDKKLRQFKTTGLLQKIVKEREMPKIHEHKEPHVLTVEHLAIGFYIWAITAVIALVVFCLECLTNKIARS